MLPPAPPEGDGLPRLSTARAYVSAIAVFAAFFGTGVISAGEALAARLPLVTRLGWLQSAPESFALLATAAIGVAVTALLGRTQGLSMRDLGWRLPPAASGVRPASRFVMALAGALVAVWAGSGVTASLATGSNDLHVVSYPDIALGLSSAVNAAFLEESVVLSFVVVTLLEARRPLVEIVVVAIALRMSYHIYYGPGVAGVALWAAAFLWIFWRTASIVPLVVAHALWDVSAALSARFAGAGAAFAIFTFALVALGFALVMLDRSSGSGSRPARQPAGAPPPEKGHGSSEDTGPRTET